MDDALLLAAGLVGAGLLLGMAGAAGFILQRRRQAWALIESWSSAGDPRQPGAPAAHGSLLIGEDQLGGVGVAVAEQGLVLWRRRGVPRVLGWTRIRRLVPLVAANGEVRAVTVELSDRAWGPDHFRVAWSAALSARVLDQGCGRLAG